MKTFSYILFALVGGYISGIVISELFGAIGYLWFDQVIGIKYLPIYLALLSASVAILWSIRSKVNE